jgi:hypothetical protein
MTAGEMRRVLLLDFPIELMSQARQHSEALVREFQLIVHGAEDEDTGVPARLLELASESERRYEGMNPQAEEMVDAAIERGEAYIDLELFVPPSFKQDTLDAVPILLEVEEYCRRGDMLTLLPSPQLRGFWQWYLTEYVRQLDGEPPISWKAWNAAANPSPADPN